jgi:hypothetical protein
MKGGIKLYAVALAGTPTTETAKPAVWTYT